MTTTTSPIPDTPGIPDTPDVPDTPAVPGTPDHGHVPEPKLVPEPKPVHEPVTRPAPTPAAPPDGAVAGGRPVRLIHTESTTEIPVHLLFRDASQPAPVRLRPAVVARRPGAGRQDAGERPRPAAPRVDPDLVERPARVLPGAVGVLAGMCGAVGCLAASWWTGALPPLAAEALGLSARAGAGALGPGQWAAYAGSGALGLFGFGGLARGRTGRAWVLGLFGRYRGTVRRTGLLWVNPLLLRRRVDVRLRHWRGEPMQAADRSGVPLRVAVLVVWRVRDTARATLGVEDHEGYLRACVEAALLRVPMTAPGAGRDATQAAQDALTRLVAADCAPVGVEVFTVRPVRVEYAPEVAAAMHRRRIAALDAQHRASVLSSVVDSVEDTVTRLTVRGLVELDDYERKALVKDLTVAFCAGRGEPGP
ncbi:SPFH domain-containing protein [Streptomyces capillispiralis]|uniref:SPFH domain/Band 7 family protein n=1 Tax=Streptomyces capillispiralis TaxID=68182 RepID=A0A561TJH2_9ACTN|nr:SPFH domain-containing protein [Streptomyces capillispiralis]TWF87277.1 SPFH domain/Band 7 family protein [Streptomyces capillispiralis]GHH92800.1 membrane protein [Streptomyces capillispiralis]